MSDWIVLRLIQLCALSGCSHQELAGYHVTLEDGILKVKTRKALAGAVMMHDDDLLVMPGGPVRRVQVKNERNI